ncbi:hypothetical protein WJX81_004359 [Elliptochloris bilobata]|uniref:BZIP domain-containing protein n=1 Tax=Elliptochloris bilobata TaxID=381761 RepID=A0AAW1QJW3_9CHLO
MQRVKLLKASAKGSPTLFGSPHSATHSASELDGVVFDGLELGPELQFLFTSGTAPSPSNSGSGGPGCSKDYSDAEKACREFESAELSPTVRTPSSKPPARGSGLRLVTRLDASPTGAGAHGSLSGPSGCTAESKQDVAATPDSLSGRRQPQRRAAQVAAQITAQAAAEEGPDAGLARADSGSRSDDDNDELDMDMEMEFDSDGVAGSGKPMQKRQRRRVVVEPRDANGRLYTAAEIRRMKRRITNRESARRMRLKRQEEWGVIKQQMRSMREQNQSAAAANKSLQASLHKVESQAVHWQELWRSAAASNAQLSQRVSQLQDALAGGSGGSVVPPGLPAISAVRFDLEPGLPSPGGLGEALLEDALLEEVGALPETPTGIGRSHSAALPASPFGGLAPITSGIRRAASAQRGPLDLQSAFVSAASAPPLEALVPKPLAGSPGARPPRPPGHHNPAVGGGARGGEAELDAELRGFGEGPYDSIFEGL